ncbi:hypothetical protein NMG29_30875 [Streptomyces cocklensis]|jgi:hypothetical protein|uniref:Uncharacterized protein n=1 Tax=Actinacidiphila cocklensis TaxID=887465 RepID=A0A9W4DKT9_9ACTN|nr:hypothetical protein [Actinacidiphila cocklensis]MDD1062562.1 hypothetical protein [Actinacidiphila cocklensis]WSX72427.1 hypothetical protein OH826_00185 [Streptomyces sp. NBC_00899]WSX81503.1 hypothetical protein OH826_51310 [Streptomyces sp. NBC_00899]CAG6391879.1 hypothetical protein SCOCK_140077 [Actinacidiphila cocklensis]
MGSSSSWQFTRYGLIVPAATLAVSALYLWLRYFALAYIGERRRPAAGLRSRRSTAATRRDNAPHGA